MLKGILLVAAALASNGTQRPQKCWVEAHDYFSGKQLGEYDRMPRRNADALKAYQQLFDPFTRYQVRCEGEFET